ncbi:hypothetical protein ACFL0Y_04265 [Patescibacteria group bacterium]
MNVETRRGGLTRGLLNNLVPRGDFEQWTKIAEINPNIVVEEDKDKGPFLGMVRIKVTQTVSAGKK